MKWTYTDVHAPDPQLSSNIRTSTRLLPSIRALAASRPNSASSSVDGTLHSGARSRSRHSAYDTETEGQGEIQLLARRILEFADGEGDDVGTTPVRTASSAGIAAAMQAQGRDAGEGEHDELRKSVREAFGGGSYRSGH
jgi:vacuolar protein 8